MARPYLHGTSGGVKTLAANTTLSMADSGKVFICSQAGAYDITLPEVGDAKGWVGTFILGTAGSNDFDIIGGTADVMFGAIVGDTNTTINAADKVTFAASNANKGDRIDIVCDGASYFVTSWADAAADVGASG